MPLSTPVATTTDANGDRMLVHAKCKGPFERQRANELNAKSKRSMLKGWVIRRTADEWGVKHEDGCRCPEHNVKNPWDVDEPEESGDNEVEFE